jgi:hypothetical protein
MICASHAKIVDPETLFVGAGKRRFENAADGQLCVKVDLSQSQVLDRP